MKNFRIIVALSMIVQIVFAQQADQYDSLVQTPHEQFDYIAQNLNLSEVTSGFLLDKTLPLLTITLFTGGD